MVVEEALGRVQDVLLRDAVAGELLQHVFEIARRGLVGADVFRREDGVELDAQLLVGEGEAVVVDVRQDDQLVVLLQILEGLGGVAERPASPRIERP